jgi:hypothetical protein
MCLIGGLFTCFLCLVVLALVWGLILNVFGAINKATGGSLGFISLVPWWVWPLALIVFLNRWLRTLALIVGGGWAAEAFLNFPPGSQPLGFFTGAGICAFVCLLCAISKPRRQVK